MKIIFDDSNIWCGLSLLKDAYIEAMVHNEKIDPHSIRCDIEAIVEALQGDGAVKDMDLIITRRKTNIHDAKIRVLEDEINKLKKELNSRTASEDKNKGGDG